MRSPPSYIEIGKNTIVNALLVRRGKESESVKEIIKKYNAKCLGSETKNFIIRRENFMTLYERYIEMCDELNKCVKQKDWEKYNLLEKEFYKLCEKILEVLYGRK